MPFSCCRLFLPLEECGQAEVRQHAQSIQDTVYNSHQELNDLLPSEELNLEPLVVFANDGPPPNVPTLSEEGYRLLRLGKRQGSFLSVSYTCDDFQQVCVCKFRFHVFLIMFSCVCLWLHQGWGAL